MVALIVPVLYNFEGFTRLMHSVDYPVRTIVIPNYDNNIGVAAAWNKGLSQVTDENEYAIIANDDVEFHHHAIERLISALDDFDLISAVATPDPPRGPEVHGFPDFACFAIKPVDFVSKFGTFDENFFPAYFEDNDMVHRINVGNGRQGVHMSAGINHEGSATQFWNGGKVVSDKQFEENRDRYIAKWGGRPTEETFYAPFDGMTNKTYKEW